MTILGHPSGQMGNELKARGFEKNLANGDLHLKRFTATLAVELLHTNEEIFY